MDNVKEYRCQYCNKLFFKGDITQAIIEVKCIKCKHFNEIDESKCKHSLLCSVGHSK